MNLRQYARGKPCLTRIPGVCNHNPETTVLAHLPGAGLAIKSDDIQGAWGCSDCHDVVDFRRNEYLKEFGIVGIRAFHLDGVYRTQQELLKTENKHGVTLAQAIEQWAKGLEV